MTSRGRVLALDVGERRIGVRHYADSSWLLASPYTTLQATPVAVFYKKLQHIVSVEDIVQLVVGLPVLAQWSRRSTSTAHPPLR
jgi:RNase H-fold protein (predicted Holliday junction resolvase)